MDSCDRCGGPLLELEEHCFGCAAAYQVAREDGVPVEEILAASRASARRLAEFQATQSPHEVAVREAAAQERVQRRLAGELPPFIPRLEAKAFAGSMLADGERFDRVRLEFTSQGVHCFDPTSGARLFRRPWHHIDSIDTEGPDALQQRVTAPRVLAGGILAWAFKKNATRSYIVVETIGADEVFFQVEGVTAIELRAALSPVTGWFRRNRDAIHDAF